MHRVLFTLDVLREIFSHVDYIPSHTRPSLIPESLAALARTCKTFHDPAMDCLWAHVNDLELLLGCVTRLHPLIYEDRNDEYTRDHWSRSVEPLSQDETCQFLRHAARVRSLLINSNRDYFRLLSVLPIDICVFPRLLSLSWMVRPADKMYLRLFLSPMLRRCDVDVDCDLQSIARRCTILDSLHIQAISQLVASRYSRLSDAICSCNRLVTLCCPPLDSTAWEYLSNLPTLVKLDIHGHGADHLLDQDNLNLAPFVNVTSFTFRPAAPTFVTVANMITVLQRSEFPSLKESKLCVGDTPWAQAEQLFRALSQCKACETLDHLHVFFHDPEGWQGSVSSLPLVGSFLCFTQLRRLTLSVIGSIYLDNDLLLEAMSSWPYIESLELFDEGFHEPKVTFRGLFAGLRLCPHLHTLQVAMDAVNIDIDPKAESFQHPSLRLLDVGYSPVTDAEAVALIISSMLPCVDEVQCGCDNKHVSLWAKSNRYLARFRG